MLAFSQRLITATLRKVLKRLHYPLEVMLTCVRWYVAYPLSLRHVEEMMQSAALVDDNYLGRRVASRGNVIPLFDVVFPVFVSHSGSQGNCCLLYTSPSPRD